MRKIVLQSSSFSSHDEKKKKLKLFFGFKICLISKTVFRSQDFATTISLESLTFFFWIHVGVEEVSDTVTSSSQRCTGFIHRNVKFST